jgi:hypothetical protein
MMTRVVGALVVALTLVSASPARAVPVFARRYHTSCSTCHSPFPRLNPFGEAFRRNGYQFPAGGDAEAMREPPVTMVADPYKQLFPNSFWPSDLPAWLPVALVLDTGVPIYPDSSVRPVGEQVISFDRIYAAVELKAAARFGRDVALFAGVNLNSDSGVQFTRGFLVFSNLFRPNALNLRVGQFEPQVFSFSNYRRGLGPNYLILSSKITHSNWAWDFVRGLNLSGTIAGRFGWDLAYVQGVEGSYNLDGIRQIPRDGYAHAYVKLGGLRLDGVEPNGYAPPPSGERSVQIGCFAYAGLHDVVVDNDRTKPPEEDVLYKAGGDVDALLGRVQLLAAAAYEKHRFEKTGPVSRTQVLGELLVTIFPWFVASARSELNFEQSSVGVRLTPMFTMLPRVNLKLQAWVQVEKDLARDDFHVTEIDIAGRYAF